MTTRIHGRVTAVLAFALTGALASASPALAGDTTIELESVADNTLIEDESGAVSGGASREFYVGRVGPNGKNTLRRGVVRFDVAASVPAGATIESARLTLQADRLGGSASPRVIKLHRLLASWGEEASLSFGGGGGLARPGDATWLHRERPDVFWETPGGDFVSDPSASRTVNSIGVWEWNSTPELVADVQAWLDDPSSDHGWAVLGEEGGTPQTVVRFLARESFAGVIPTLSITYSTGGTPGDLDGNGLVDGADLAILLGQWGGDGSADLDGNGVVNGADLAILLGNWS